MARVNPFSQLTTLSTPLLESTEHLQTLSDKRVIFQILEAMNELGSLLSSLKMDSLRSRTSSEDLLTRCTNSEMNSYMGQTATALFRAAVVFLPMEELHQKALQALGEAPNAIMQGHLNASSSQKNLLNKEIEEDLKSNSLFQQFSGSMQELALQLIRHSSLSV